MNLYKSVKVISWILFLIAFSILAVIVCAYVNLKFFIPPDCKIHNLFCSRAPLSYFLLKLLIKPDLFFWVLWLLLVVWLKRLEKRRTEQ